MSACVCVLLLLRLRPVCFFIVALRPQLNQSIYICALASREFYIYKLFQVYVNSSCTTYYFLLYIHLIPSNANVLPCRFQHLIPSSINANVHVPDSDQFHVLAS